MDNNHFLIFKDTNIFDEYIITEELNRTNYSITLHVEHKQTQKSFILKRFNQSFLKTKIQKITEELETSSLNQHPNIIGTYSIYQYSAYFDVLSEYCRGKNLLVRLEILANDFHVFYTEKEIAEIVFQLLCVINFAHSKGILHSDLKPENVLFLKDDPRSLKIKIANFGVASLFEEMRGKAGGKMDFKDWSFNSPNEQSGFAAAKESDIWSAGCILFVLLTGKMPVIDANLVSIQSGLASNKKISNEAKDILRKMLIHSHSAKADELLNHPFITQRLNQKEKSFFVSGERDFAKIECFKAFVKERKEKLKQLKSNRKNFENFLDFNDETYQRRTYPKLIFDYVEYFNVSEKSAFSREKSNKELIEEENNNFSNQEKK